MSRTQVEEYFSRNGTVACWWKPEDNRWYKKQFGYLEHCGTFKNRIVADMGTGKGRFAHYFAEKGAKEVYACDISGEMLEIAKARALQRGIQEKVSFKKGNILDIDLPDDYFDLVCCMETFIHLPHPQEAVIRMAKALKKGGVIIANTDTAMLRFRLPRNIYYLLYWVNSCESFFMPLQYCKALIPFRRLADTCLRTSPGKTAYAPEALDKFVSLRQLKTVNDTFEFLGKYPDADLLFPMDALHVMPKEKFIALFHNAGLQVEKVMQEGHWFFPKGTIVIARK